MVDTNFSVLQFVLLGFSDVPQMRIYLLFMFFVMYLITLLGNVVILSCIVYDKALHSPMYFFLSNLSLVDICFTSSTIPTLLSTLISNKRSLSFLACISQMFSFISFGNLENNILAVMAYDRYVAICSPLRYTARMKSSLCVWLVAISWIAACSHSLLHTLMVTGLRYVGLKKVFHFFCEISQVLAVADSDTSLNFSLIITEGAVSVGIPFLCVILSYGFILVAIFQLHSTEGRQKAFSTCSSHLTTVCLFYGTITAVYFRPSGGSGGVGERVATLGYTLLTPMLNPIIYGLRNEAMKKVIGKAFL
ncbi:PREDICTED: olfactory receptor 1361-like [Nanorana parkeri]|uniref:olfactory receptor 1361-like n=1 Tax=Nanorana parkeri TaxID=125878 RepID=UPI0008546B10|nr:PREDICTED: olfactory receptor 1361-like [Nanorana parkeri]